MAQNSNPLQLLTESEQALINNCVKNVKRSFLKMAVNAQKIIEETEFAERNLLSLATVLKIEVAK